MVRNVGETATGSGHTMPYGDWVEGMVEAGERLLRYLPNKLVVTWGFGSGGQ